MASARGSAGFAIALVAMGFCFILTLILAILLYVQYSGAESQAQEAREKLQQYVSTDLERDAMVRGMLASYQSNGRPVVGQLLDEVRYLKAEVFGNRDVELVDIDEREDLLSTRKRELNVTHSLLATIESLRETINVLEGERDDVQQALDEAQAKFSTLEEARQRVEQSFDQNTAQLSSQVEQTASAFETTSQATSQKLSEVESQMASMRTNMQQEINQREARISDLETEVRTLQRRLDDILGESEEGMRPEALLRADGEIVSVSDDDKTVYINRGSRDRVMLGMTFEVFRSEQLIRLDDDDEFRGKATIEVFQIGESTSRARVVRLSRGEVLRQGDVIANLVYDPHATYSFYIFGDFDVDRDGEFSRADRRRLESMVREWGGKVADDLDHDVDYLVLGRRPEMPERPAEGELNPQVLAEYRRAMAAFEQYHDLEADARRLSIPVLNQNRFLTFMGVYQQR